MHISWPHWNLSTYPDSSWCACRVSGILGPQCPKNTPSPPQLFTLVPQTLEGMSEVLSPPSRRDLRRIDKNSLAAQDVMWLGGWQPYLTSRRPPPSWYFYNHSPWMYFITWSERKYAFFLDKGCGCTLINLGGFSTARGLALARRRLGRLSLLSSHFFFGPRSNNNGPSVIPDISMPRILYSILFFINSLVILSEDRFVSKGKLAEDWLTRLLLPWLTLKSWT